MMKPDRLDQLFKTVSDPTRLRLINLLRLGSICVCEIQSILQIPQSTVSRHLAGLRHAGIATDSRSGNKIIYSLAAADSPQIAALYRLLDKCCPFDEVLKADLSRLNRAIKKGECCLYHFGVEGKSSPSTVERTF
jgi:ArsR family transcriptional regulator, arsenate/arsenite/antimonite-responsive transcriptional repressor